MNQSILFNDDIHFDHENNQWTFSGLIAGELIKIIVSSDQQPFTESLPDNIKLDWESDVEDWLEDNEPEQGTIRLYS